MKLSRKTLSYTYKNKQHGFTLLEILISLGISFVLILGVMQVYTNSHESFRKADAVARIQENGRFALDDLGNLIKQAGYREDPSISFEQTFPVNTSSNDPSKHFEIQGQFIQGLDAQESTNLPTVNLSDVISVRFSGSADLLVFDCHGNSVPAQSISINTWFIANNNENIPSLFCDNGIEQRPIVPGVENMQIVYGIDTDSDQAADQYLSAIEVGDQWNSIVSARFHLILLSINDKISSNIEDIPVFLGENTNTSFTTNNDLRVRKQFVTTLSLRNQLL